MPKTEIYVGNLIRDITRKEIEDVFEKYGRLRRCDLKNKGFGATYAFLEFDDERDAEVNQTILFHLFLENMMWLVCFFLKNKIIRTVERLLTEYRV